MGTQAEAIDLINSGYNVFMSGGAGVGKSYVIKLITNNNTVLSAPTGISALNIQGETCHSIFGIPYGIPTEEDKSKQSKVLYDLFGKHSKVTRLVIDEVSMCRADHLDLIDYKLRKIRQNNKPFGGIQVIIVGDLWQLPPIVTSDEKPFYRRLYKSPFVFDSNAYKEGNFKYVELTKVYRQEDEYQIELLRKIRTKQKGWEQAVEEINNICKAKHDDTALNLCVFNKDADKMNKIHFERNLNPVVSYSAIIEGKFKQKDCAVGNIIQLKKGLRVVICANCPDKAYRNGQMGKVIDMLEESVIVELDDGEIVDVIPHKWETFKYKNGIKGLSKTVVGSCKQIPLRQGNAISIDKSQSLTLDNIVINMGKGAFRAALAFVALSRARDLKNVSLTRPLKESDIIVSSKVQKFFKTLKYRQK